MFYPTASLLRKLSSLALRALGRDLTNSGERVDIHYKGNVEFKKLDMYQKSHYKRYEFACRLLDRDMLVGDLACGTGYGTVMMGNAVRHAYGCDISPIIRSIRKRYGKCDRVTFIQSDIFLVNEIPELNAIVSFETVEHFPDPLVAKLFKKFNAMLCDKGLLVFSVPFIQPATSASRRHHKVFEIDEAKATRWVNDGGFEIQNFFYQNYLTHEILPSVEPKDFMICVCRKIYSV